MDEFTDGQDITENAEQITEDINDSNSETEVSETEETYVQSSLTQDNTQLNQNDTADAVTVSPESEQTVIEESNEISYKDLVTVLTEHNEEIEAIHELEEKRQEFYTVYQNMLFTLIIGIGLLFGGLCAVILANYLRHG